MTDKKAGQEKGLHNTCWASLGIVDGVELPCLRALPCPVHTPAPQKKPG